jgi:hypothetical protein
MSFLYCGFWDGGFIRHVAGGSRSFGGLGVEEGWEGVEGVREVGGLLKGMRLLVAVVGGRDG